MCQCRTAGATRTCIRESTKVATAARALVEPRRGSTACRGVRVTCLCCPITMTAFRQSLSKLVGIMLRHTVILTSFVVALAAGCGRSKADQASTAPDSTATTPSGERANTLTGVRADAELRTACGLGEVETFFEYDSANLDPPKDTALFKLAHCLAEGPAKGKHVRVIGHTDPTGSERQNDEVGMSRARAVREYLVLHGVAHDQIEMLSMGEAGADETSPAEWPFDRRVDIHLAPPSPTAAPPAATPAK